MYVDGRTLTDISFGDVDENGLIVVPNGILEINSHTFSYHREINEVILNNEVKTIGYRAFGDCDCLRRVMIPSSVEYISESIFEGCGSLEYVDMNNCKVLNKSIFGDDCNPMCKVKFHDKTYTIEDIVDYGIKFDLREVV